ncbi:unannotated protein [freshwater metagenome]|uniref:Unannotated protein n=1 Tax=freshwater metagenome TaxID=449393 RepID=A0A6J7C8Q9_9ZZZZ
MLIALVERGDDLQTLDRLLAALGAERLAAAADVVDRCAQLDLFLVEVDAVDERLDRVGARATLEVIAVTVAQLAPQQLVVDDQTAMKALELVPRTAQEIDLHLVTLADAGHFLLGGGLDLAGIGRTGSVGLALGRVAFELLEAAVDRQFEFLTDRVALLEELGFQVRQLGVALVLVDPGDQVGGEVNDLLELLGLEFFLRQQAGQQVCQPATGTA